MPDLIVPEILVVHRDGEVEPCCVLWRGVDLMHEGDGLS